ncbi:SRPBCC family protein [Actinacidiphila acidipaludis]|uniref:SRPBCC family protein n=1 Tax=Actinacidiphila acidipaludis TaxID=2873382 RepID=A0ABS7QF48_9ACTN|nr:SRPBCC family protein [Streptomyces acidipaludis]MBY8881461.1 SRPBCC family protein [Streptomyces acidipaludis]
MTTTSRHISAWIARPAAEVYEFARRPSNLPSWAAGLGTSVEEVDGRWVADSPMGHVVVSFAPPNDFGVLDHDVTLPSGETVSNPMRVVPDDGGSEVVFTLRRRPGMSDDDFARDAAAVAADLATLKALLERPA